MRPLVRDRVRIHIIAIVLSAAGCTTYHQTETLTNTKAWDGVRYDEQVVIATEPTGCRLYLQDRYIGVSPVQTTLTIQNMRVLQKGHALATYARTYETIHLPYAPPSERLESSEPFTYDGPLAADTGSWTWTCKAYKEGYEPSSYTITITSDDDALRSAIGAVQPSGDGKLPSPITREGHRDVLIPLSPVTGYPPPSISTPQEQPQREKQ